MPSESQQQQHHRRGFSLSSAITSDRDEDLTLFKDMRRKEEERKLSLPEEPGMHTPITPRRASEQSLFWMPAASIHIKSYGGSEDILASDWDKNDYDWLMTPPGTPLLLNIDDHTTSNGSSHVGGTSVKSTFKTSKVGNSESRFSRSEPPSRNVRGNLGLQQPLSANGVCPSTLTVASDTSSTRPRRHSTQTSNLAAKPPVQTSIHMSRVTSAGAKASSRLSSLNASVSLLSSTASNGGAHATTSSAHPAAPYGRSASRPSTPLKRSPSPSHPCNIPTTLIRCSSASRASSVIFKGATLSRASSPTIKALSPEALNGFPERLPNLRTTIHEKPSTGSRSSSSKADIGECFHSTVQNRRQSGSSLVAKGQTTTSLQNGGKGLNKSGRVDSSLATANSKVGEKIMAAKKPAVSAKEGQGSAADSHVKKASKGSSLRDVKSILSSVRESSAGLGRNLSKKSVDSGLKHTDPCKGMPHKFRSFMSSMSRSPLLSKRSGSNGTHSASSVSDSPMATSSCTSSEHNMSIVIDPDSSELGDESVSEKGSRSSAASQHDFFALGREKRISSWLRSPDYQDDDADIMQIFEQEGLQSLSGPESPLISELEGTIECDNFCLDPIQPL